MVTEDSYEVDWIFGTPVDDLIKLLQSLKHDHPKAHDIYLEEVWTGYEDVEYHVCIERDETPEEEQARLIKEQREREREEWLKKEHERIDKVRQAILEKEEELAKLKMQQRSWIE